MKKQNGYGMHSHTSSLSKEKVCIAWIIENSMLQDSKLNLNLNSERII